MNNTAAPDTNVNCLIQPNPDIIGVGIRVSFYVLSLVGPIISFVANSPEFTASVESSLGITGLALFLTTVILTSKNTIDLFHAICIFHLLGLVGISITPKSAKGTSVARFWTFTALYFVAVTGSLSYLTYVFATAPTFGSHPECNGGVKYVLFGVSISATNAVVRWIFVASFGLILFGYFISLMITAGIFCCCVDRFEGQVRDPARRGRKPFRFIVGHEIGCVYVIIMLELIIKRNSIGPGINDWTFGQILAMMMLIAPLIELISSVLGEKDHET